MPDQSVEVTFDPNADPQFTFVPETVTMTKAGKIVFHRRPQNAPWKFKLGSVKGDTSGQFTPSVQGNGSQLHMDDKFTDTINCPCHGSAYSIDDGSVVGGPAPAPLAEEKLVVEGGSIDLA